MRPLPLEGLVYERRGECAEAWVRCSLSDLRCRRVRAVLPGCAVPVWVSWFKLRRDRGEFAWRYVVSIEPAEGETIKRWGRRRWRIEAFFKTAKSRFGLDRFG